MPASKPTLALTTPVSASFPAEALRSAVSARTPRSAAWRESLASAGLPSAGLPSAGLPSAGLVSPAIAAIKTEDAFVRTPITPPVAYMDFLKMASPVFPSPCMASPPLTGKAPLNRTSTAGSARSIQSVASAGSEDSAEGERDEKEIDSAPSTATSESTDCSCDCDHVHKSPKPVFAAPTQPMSAPPAAANFPSLKIPPSPAVSNPGETPVMSPFSARSVRSPFDWDAALKARRFAESKSSHSCGKSKTSIRHVREVITRTVTYTPRMEPAPKGKRRKVE